MTDLIIKLTGEITDTNFDGWKENLIAQIKATRKDLITDDDFAEAGDLVKSIKSAERALKAAKQSAIEQAADIQKLFATIDEVSQEAREARLSLERQIKVRKAEIIESIVDEGFNDVAELLEQQNDNFALLDHSSWKNRQRFEDAVKGKRSSSSMEKAIAALIRDIKTEIENQSVEAGTKSERLGSIDDEYVPLFQDRQSLIRMTLDDLNETISQRIDFYLKEKSEAEAEKKAAEEKAQEQESSSAADSDPESSDEISPDRIELPLGQSDREPDPGELPDGLDIPTRYIITIEVDATDDVASDIADEIDQRYRDNKHVVNVKFVELI